MDYISRIILPKLTHTKADENMSDYALKLGLWYTSTSQSYLQRTNKFDSSWLSSATSDAYVALKLKAIFNVSDFITFQNFDECNAAVNGLADEKFNEGLLYIAKDKQSLFLNFWEKIRNSLAHGAFNQIDGRTYLMNQHKPKPDAKVNCLLQTDSDLSYTIKKLWEDFEDSLLAPDVFKYDCLDTVLRFRVEAGRYYSETMGRYVVIDDAFRFDSEKRVATVKALIDTYDDNELTDIIVSENLGSISEKNLRSENGNVRIISQSKLIDYYEIEHIVLTK